MSCIFMSCNFMSCIFMSCNFMSCIFMSCNFMPCISVRHFHVLQFHVLHISPSISCPAISCLAYWSVNFMSYIFMSCIFSAPAQRSRRQRHGGEGNYEGVSPPQLISSGGDTNYLFTPSTPLANTGSVSKLQQNKINQPAYDTRPWRYINQLSYLLTSVRR